MNGCTISVNVSEIDCYVVEVCTAGPQGTEGPEGPSGPPLNSVALALSASINNLAASNAEGQATRVLLIPALGDSVISGVISPLIDGFKLEIFNPSLVDSLRFLSLSGASLAPNQFLCPGNVTFTIQPGGGATIEWIEALGFWMFLQ